MQLHDEQSNRPMFDNVNDSVSVGRFSRKHDFTESSNENPHKRTVQEYNYLYTYLSTILYALILVIESIFQFRWIHHSHSSISFFWLESCVIALFFKICRRKRIARLVVQKKSVQLLMWWWTGLKKSVAWIICDLTNDRLPFLTIASQIDCRNSYKVYVWLKLYCFAHNEFRPEREWFRLEGEVTKEKEIFSSCKKISPFHLSIEFKKKT